MKEKLQVLARYRLSRAGEALADGGHLLEKGSLVGAVNRFYYAAFYAARALLATEQMDSARHSGVISLFQKHFVATGKVNMDTARALPRSFERRQKIDYGDFATIEAEDAQSVRRDVQGSSKSVHVR